MLLCIDIGNTNIVFGLVENNIIKSTYRIVTNSSMTSDEYYQKVNGILKNNVIDDVIISCVVPALDHVYTDLFVNYYNIKPLFVGPGIKSGLKLKIENPKSLGADLLCDAVGASQKFGNPCIIVDLGTASKVIVVNSKGEYLGGAIAPGMRGSLDSLIKNAAKLSDTSLERPRNVIGNDTTTCIQSGMIYGTASMIDGMVRRTIKELKEDNVKVILTGGLSSTVKDVLEIDVIHEPNILIEGLIYLYNKNKK